MAGAQTLKAGLDPESPPPAWLVDLVREARRIHASDRPRAKESAKALAPHAEDEGFCHEFAAIKLANKQRLAGFIRRETGVIVDPQSMFDMHIKRIHEYKRQLLNLLQVIARYNGTGDTNMYFAGLTATASGFEVSLWVNAGGTWNKLAGQSVMTGNGTLQLAISGTNLQVSFNGNLLISLTDGSLTGPGTFGLRTTAGAIVDNFSVN